MSDARADAPLDVVVVGAGLAGLALARELHAAGHAPVVLERARGVGGRCATRRIDGQPVDHGLAFLHGRSPEFLAELDAVGDAAALPGWPHVREGEGVPCQPRAFDDAERRLAFGAGVSALPKHLARGLDVRLGANVTTLVPGAAGDAAWGIELASGERLRARAVVLTQPLPTALELLARTGPPPAALAAVLPLLRLVRTLPCLTLIARYPHDVPRPRWDIAYPREDETLGLVVHDSARAGRPRPTLVLQARPRFSRSALAESAPDWAPRLLRAAAAAYGDWIARPDDVQAHVWRHARVAAGTELAAPLLVTLEGGERLGFAGDGLHAACGAEGAFRSGRRLAHQLLEHLPRRA